MADEWHPYNYIPSAWAAAVFAGLFGITTLAHTYQVYIKRTWYFIPLVLGGVFEVVGFIGRIFSRSNDLSALAPFLIQAIFILTAPTLFAASIYIVLGRIILLVDGERYSWIRQRHLTWAFVMGDMMSLSLQSNGGGLTGGKSEFAINLGKIMIIAGLFAQLAFFGLFIGVAGRFHYRLLNDKPVEKHVSFRWFHWLNRFRWRKASRPSSSTYATYNGPIAVNINELPWRRHIYVLYFSSVLVFVRSVFRVIEYIQGEDGYLLSNEMYLYVFDAVLMFVVMVMFNLIHPSQLTDLYQARVDGARRAAADLELQRTTESRASEGHTPFLGSGGKGRG
ncbi:RTA1-domain-containing protein [Lojkania enalia]|uniref:RTA1-domain-containing protein n=1 Tax=Lojkania enalia TaxID=147567 RepID=A0A9P4K0I8_9PLEO|nr:RTA1-domain-containing protein [Didymosphaeria enalia]